ncbi:MAG: ABC transporter ATP-binding protein [Firmicutes bacterium]|nr:ABC transporter ATP-binding protein [Bacillota bacterium]
MAVECRNVSISFTGKTHALKDINLQVEPGEYVSLVGPSGCGKSTLLRIIAGLLSPTTGQALVFGRNGTPAQRKLGFVFQEPTLLPWRTALDNVALPLEIKGVSKEERRERAWQALKDVGLASAAHHYPAELSGGMKQRVSLARALVEEAKLLLMDEPFAALDALRRERFNYEMWRLGHKKKLTLILVTHSITEAVWMSHRVLVMSESPGRIIGEVKVPLPEERESSILSTPGFASLCGKIRSLLAQGGDKQ